MQSRNPDRKQIINTALHLQLYLQEVNPPPRPRCRVSNCHLRVQAFVARGPGMRLTSVADPNVVLF
jgi:hypothetical protein